MLPLRDLLHIDGKHPTSIFVVADNARSPARSFSFEKKCQRPTYRSLLRKHSSSFEESRWEASIEQCPENHSQDKEVLRNGLLRMPTRQRSRGNIHNNDTSSRTSTSPNRKNAPLRVPVRQNSFTHHKPSQAVDGAKAA